MTMTEQPDLFSSVPEIVEERPAPGATLDERFATFHALNPWVAERLLRLTRDLVARGRTRIGIKALAEVVRWNYWMTTDDPSSDFRLNNSYLSRYSRMLMAEHPDLDGVFETRELRS